MGGVYSTISLCLGYCLCTSASSLCNACLGATSPGTTGRKRSVLLLTLAIVLALFFQYMLAPNILGHETGWWNFYKRLPGMGKHVYAGWIDGCDAYSGDEGLLRQCVGNSAVYRPTLLASVFFAVAAVASKCRPAINREVWPAKYGLYLLLVLASVFVPNSPLFDGLYLHLSRLGAMAFIVLQQVILIDVAYNWNESWVAKSDECDRVEGYGSGVKWLRAIVAACVAMYLASIVGISLLFEYFKGCPENTTVVFLTLVGILVVTAIQLSGAEGSLLTSSVISLYATYLASSVVSKNPNPECNPRLGHDDVWGMVIGLLLTCVSLAWTGWSWTAEGRLNADAVQSARPVSHPSQRDSLGGVGGSLDLGVPFVNPDDEPPTGVVLETERDPGNHGGRELWKLNVVLSLISCWVAVSLTGWGSIQGVAGGEDEEAHTAANPQIGKVNMTMIAISQWLALILYGWTLVAPKIFPDRDFS